MKKLIALLLSLVLLTLALTGCGETMKAESSVNGMFKAFKELNIAEAQKYVNVEDIKNAGSESDKDSDETSEMFFEFIFGNLSHEIVSSEKVDNKTVLVKTKITAVDMKPVLGEFFKEYLAYAFSAAFSDPQPTEEEQTKKMEEIFAECTSDPDLKTITTEVDIKVVKAADNKWKIEADDTFVNAMLGGFVEAMEELGDSFSS